MATLMTCDPHITDPLAAELNAVIHGLQLAIDSGLTKLIVEGDSVSIIQALQSKDHNMSWLGNRVTEARKLLYQLEQWKLSAIPREANIYGCSWIS